MDDTADVRRRMIRLEEKMDAHHAATDIRMSSIERGQFIMEQRMSAMVERQSKMEELLHRALLILETWQQGA